MTSPMEYQQLGASGLMVSVITLGAMTYGGRGTFAQAAAGLRLSEERRGGARPTGQPRAAATKA
jgi:aryl-alcohol dehydrogenase-like predicted oxidoreductase